MLFKKALSLVLCLLMMFTVSTSVLAESIGSLREQLSEAQDKSAEIQSKIDELEAEAAPFEEQAYAIKEQIDATQTEIELLRDQIRECEENIAEQQKALDELQDQFKQRLVSIYKSSNYSSVQLLLTSDNMAEYLTKNQFLKCQSEADADLFEMIITEKTKLEEEQVILNSAKEELDEKIEALDEQYEKYNKIVAEFESQIAMHQQTLEEQEALEEDIRDQIREAEEAMVGNQTGGGGYNEWESTGSGAFAWPVLGYYSISSYYGWRWGRLHAGLDISSSGIYGAPIVASDSGTVILSYAGDYGGYGNCVMISHGNGYVTLYAHMAYAPSVYEGETVSQGEIIGYVGSTGNSTGPHLHFEIRYNGSPMDPLNYL